MGSYNNKNDSWRQPNPSDVVSQSYGVDLTDQEKELLKLPPNSLFMKIWSGLSLINDRINDCQAKIPSISSE